MQPSSVHALFSFPLGGQIRQGQQEGSYQISSPLVQSLLSAKRLGTLEADIFSLLLTLLAEDGLE